MTCHDYISCVDKKQALKILEEIANEDFHKPIPEKDALLALGAIFCGDYHKAELYAKKVDTYSDFKDTVNLCLRM